MADRATQTLQELLAAADVRLDGERPWDPQVHDPRFARRVLAGGSIGLGESYMDGDWEVERLDQFLERLMRAGLDRTARLPLRALATVAWHRLINPQTGRRAFRVGEQHYDTGNDLFEAMLDRRMAYSCGYWKDADTLDAAQEAKLDLICRKLRLQPGMSLLDIGCGWGSLLGFAAERYGVSAFGITVSREQAELARKRCAGLPVTVEVMDYRELDQRFDAVASVGMAEHVGWRNYRTYLETAHRCLAPGGLFLLHTIGSNRTVRRTDPWIQKYIFPNSMLPSVAQLGQAAEDLLVVEDLQNFGPDYERTLMAWDENFRAAWPRLAEHYGERFYRMWRYYLMASAASFRARRIQLWQWVLAREPAAERYDAPR